MNTLGTFTIIKNEKAWIGPHLESWLPHVDQMVFFDSSDDGTAEIIKHFLRTSRYGDKIKLVEGKDCKDLKDDYVRLFNECLWSLDTDLAIFAHPDMVLVDPGNLRDLPETTIAASMRMVSYAGDPEGPWYEIAGRGEGWKNVYRLRPDLGAHYFGHYGAQNEDVYFSQITGTKHEHHGPDFHKYPHQVEETGAIINHFSDVRPYERRLDRMRKCLLNQGYHPESVTAIAKGHPRVSLEKGMGFEFYPVAVLEASMRQQISKYQEFWREPVA